MTPDVTPLPKPPADPVAELAARADAAAAYYEAVIAYLDPENQYTDSRLHVMEEAERALLAALDAAGFAVVPKVNPLSNFGDDENDRMWWQQDEYSNADRLRDDDPRCAWHDPGIPQAKLRPQPCKHFPTNPADGHQLADALADQTAKLIEDEAEIARLSGIEEAARALEVVEEDDESDLDVILFTLRGAGVLGTPMARILALRAALAGGSGR